MTETVRKKENTKMKIDRRPNLDDSRVGFHFARFLVSEALGLDLSIPKEAAQLYEDYSDRIAALGYVTTELLREHSSGNMEWDGFPFREVTAGEAYECVLDVRDFLRAYRPVLRAMIGHLPYGRDVMRRYISGKNFLWTLHDSVRAEIRKWLHQRTPAFKVGDIVNLCGKHYTIAEVDFHEGVYGFAYPEDDSLILFWWETVESCEVTPDHLRGMVETRTPSTGFFEKSQLN